jgi:hypothetical protein
MPREKDLKRLVRARMKKTGEAYTAARAQVLQKPRRRTTTKAPAAALRATPIPAAPPQQDYASLAGMSDAVITEKTGRNWKEWVSTLDAHRAAEMAHHDIALLVSDTYKVRPWWTQSVTVGYERIKGLRAIGQRRDGSYEANKSRTYDVPVETLFDAWADAATRRRWLDETGVKVRTAAKPKSMRLGWPDGTIVAVGFWPKSKTKCSVSVQHTKLPDSQTADRLKQFWGDQMATLAKILKT